MSAAGFLLPFAMRKHKQKRQSTPKRPAWAERFKIAYYGIGTILSLWKLIELVLAHLHI